MNRNHRKSGNQEDQTIKAIILATAIIQFINALVILATTMASLMN